MGETTIEINRAPVLTLWAAVVAECLGYDHDESLTLGKGVSGLTAQAKGRNLGIFRERLTGDGKPAPKAGIGEEFFVRLCGRNIPVKQSAEGIRCVVKDKPVDPASVERYLEKAFGESLPVFRKAMTALAKSREATTLNDVAFGLYEKFRPTVASGTRGWGQKAALSVDTISRLRSG